MVSKTFELIKVENRTVGGRWGDEQMRTEGSRRSALGMDVFADPACSLVTVLNNTCCLLKLAERVNLASAQSLESQGSPQFFTAPKSPRNGGPLSHPVPH